MYIGVGAIVIILAILIFAFYIAAISIRSITGTPIIASRIIFARIQVGIHSSISKLTLRLSATGGNLTLPSITAAIHSADTSLDVGQNTEELYPVKKRFSTSFGWINL